MYLLDTNIVIYALKGISPVLAHLEAHRDDPMALSAATLMELYYGAYKSQKGRANLARVRAIEESLKLSPWALKLPKPLEISKLDWKGRGYPLTISI